MVNVWSLGKRVLRGDRKTAVFALLTTCNCKCAMCDMWKQRRRYIPLEDAKRVLDFLSANRFIAVYLTGGEPTLHPDIVEIVRYANQLGMSTSITTNGTCSKAKVTALKEAGLHFLSVSLDHWDDAVCEAIRGVKGIKQMEENTLRHARRIGLQAYALTFLNPYIVKDGIATLIEYVNHELAVPFGFCYPTKCDVNTFRLGSQMLRDEAEASIRRCVWTIFNMKRRGYNVVNAGLYIEDILNSAWNGKRNFRCRGGEDAVYVDWEANVYPCFLKPKLFNALHEQPRFLENQACDDCFISCFREPSFFPQALGSPRLLFKELRYSDSTRRLIV
ncbi:MAG: radical SAM protein [Candidatus Bathyarchaeia archaeon]